MHPLYRELSIAMESLLGLAIMVCRLIVLRYSNHSDEQEKGFVGNTILLTQPKPEQIMQALPPSEADVSKYMSVCFNGNTMSRSAVGAEKALTVDPAEYIRCVRLRQQVCPVFADVALDEELVRRQWPQRGVPSSITEGAQSMDTLHTFTPNLDGPARMRAASCDLPCTDANDPTVVAESDAAALAELRFAVVSDVAATEHGAGAAGQDTSGPPLFDESGLPVDMPAEFLIGVQECDSHNPVDSMVAFRKSLELVHDACAQTHALARDRARAAAQAAAATSPGAQDEPAAAGAANAAAAAAELAGQRAAHVAALVDLRTVAQSMGASYQQELEHALASARMEDAVATTPQTLHVKSGKPVNMFEPQAWPAAFV